MVRTEFPFAVETVDPLWITLADGTRIAATAVAPDDRRQSAGVVEMVPYRRRDGTVFRDMDMHPYLAGHGIAAAVSTSAAPAIRMASCATNICRGSRKTRARSSPACHAGLVQRQCRHDRHFLGRVQCPAGRGAPAAGAEGHHHPVLDRRPLCRRRPLHGRRLLTENEMWSNFMLAKTAMPPDPQIVGDALARACGRAG